MSAITRSLFARHMPYAEKFRPFYGRIDMRMIQDVLAMADTGIMTPIADLGRESSSLDPHLLTVAQKRFGALAALDFKVDAVACTKANGLDQKIADEVADDVRAMLKGITNRQDAIYDLAWSLFDGRGALEIDWVRVSGRSPYQPVSLDWIHPRRLAFGPDRELRVIDTFTSGRGWWSRNGFALRDYPGKFVTWEPRYFSDYPEREGLLRRSMYWSLFKRFSARMRMVLTELFAIPWRVVEFPATTEFHETSYEDLDEAEDRAEALGGQNTVAMPPGGKLNVEWPGENSGQLFELTRTGVNEEMSKLWLGNVGTTDAIQTGMGSNVATVHKGEQNIYLTRDAFGVGARIKACLVDVWVVLNRGADYLRYSPTCTLTAEDEADRTAEQNARGTAIALSVPVSLTDYYESAQIEPPGEDEPVIVGVNDPTTGKVTTKIVYPKDWSGARIGETPPPAGPPGGAPPAPGGSTPPPSSDGGSTPPSAGGPPAVPTAPNPPAAPASTKAPTAPTPPKPPTPTVAQPGDVHSHIKAGLGLERPAPTPSGTEDELVDKHTREASRLTAGWCRTMLDAVDDQGTLADAKVALSRAAAALPLDAFARGIERATVTSLALGAMDAAYQAEHDHEEDAFRPSFAADNARTKDRTLILGAGGVLGAVPPMVQGFTLKPFNEAIAEFMGKAVLPRHLFERLTSEAKRRAFTIAGLSQQTMLDVAHDELTKSIVDGDDLATFRERLAERFDSNGWTPLNRSHVETVFRTAINGAYNSGRHVQQTQPAVLAARPYWQIRGVKDDRARPEHAAANGKVLAASDPFWTRAPLPWGFNERCTKTSRSAADLARLGLSVSNGADLKGLPDEDFKAGGGFTFDRSLFGYDGVRLANGRRIAGIPRFFGGTLLVLVDRPQGTVETGTAKDGTPWSRTWSFDGGELPGTSAGDGEPIDVFCGPDAAAPMAFWIVQRGDDPELRLALGWANIDEARAAYLSVVPAEMLDRVLPQPVEHVKALLGLPPDVRMLEVRRTLDGHDDQARDDHGRFAPGGGGSGSSSSKKEPTKPTGSGGLAAKIGGALSKAASAAVDKIKGAPGALKDALMKQVGTLKTAALGIKAAVTGKPVSHEQKAAMKTVAIKIATKVAFSAVSAALPGLGHAVGAALEHLPHAAEIVAHWVAHHAAEHTVEHLAKHAAGVHTTALRLLEADDTGEGITDGEAGAFIDQVCDSVSHVLGAMSDDDWESILGPHLPAVEPKKADHTRQPRKPDGDFAPPAKAAGHAGNPPAGAELPDEHGAALDAAEATRGVEGDRSEDAQKASALCKAEPNAASHTAAANAHFIAAAACGTNDLAGQAAHKAAGVAHQNAAAAFHERFCVRVALDIEATIAALDVESLVQLEHADDHPHGPDGKFVPTGGGSALSKMQVAGKKASATKKSNQAAEASKSAVTAEDHHAAASMHTAAAAAHSELFAVTGDQKHADLAGQHVDAANAHTALLPAKGETTVTVTPAASPKPPSVDGAKGDPKIADLKAKADAAKDKHASAVAEGKLGKMQIAGLMAAASKATAAHAAAVASVATSAASKETPLPVASPPPAAAVAAPATTAAPAAPPPGSQYAKGLAATAAANAHADKGDAALEAGNIAEAHEHFANAAAAHDKASSHYKNSADNPAAAQFKDENLAASANAKETSQAIKDKMSTIKASMPAAPAAPPAPHGGLDPYESPVVTAHPGHAAAAAAIASSAAGLSPAVGPPPEGSAVKSLIHSLPVATYSSAPPAVAAHVTSYIDQNLDKLSPQNIKAMIGFSNGHDFEIRALERGVPKAELIAGRIKKGEGTEVATAHVETSLGMVGHLHEAFGKIALSSPPPPVLYRGMSVSDRTAHEMLTQNTWSTSGMSSSASLNTHTAYGFASKNMGKPDYRGEPIKHEFVVVVEKAHASLPLTSPKVSPLYHGEREMILSPTAKYNVTKRAVDSSGRVHIHLQEQ
jgi:SPP1 gp7 family putative phage head morphogenesis protein